ncbi:MAG: DEAD/DEAH box helicase [Nanoarchaeota archaeon]|nr:DEAD/DEAH box helicase [Nanoarchaeota archaeon]
MNKFEKLGISSQILKVIEKENFEEPSEIQIKAIPLVLKGKDVIGGSATGSGKTLVFGSRIIQDCTQGKGIQSLVLTPTRELAIQVRDALAKFSQYNPLEILAVYGGVSINPQINELKIADVVVGTPGRVLDHVGRRTIDLRKVKVLVLDEADRMLDMGFLEDVEKIIKQCPSDRQTLLFSATIIPEVKRLSKRYMVDPVLVSAESMVDPKKLKQVYYDVPDSLKFSLLVHLLKDDKNSGLVMIFCSSRRNVDFVVKNLRGNKVDAIAIHGGFTQARRESSLRKFNSGKAWVLVCTDVAARGLDIKGVSHVYNYDLPRESKQYVHRIGRTARAGKDGMAVNILAQRDHENFSRVLKDNDVEIVRLETPPVSKVRTKIPAQEGSGRSSHKRGGHRRGSSRREHGRNRRR